jgi:hypothetical protein
MMRPKKTTRRPHIKVAIRSTTKLIVTNRFLKAIFIWHLLKKLLLIRFLLHMIALFRII